MSTLDLARQLAAPVARGMLPLGHADAALIASSFQAERQGAPGHPIENARLALHILRQHLKATETRQYLVVAQIKRTVAPLMAAREPSNRLLSESHTINGEAGFPLTEAQVTSVVTEAVFWHQRRQYAA